MYKVMEVAKDYNPMNKESSPMAAMVVEYGITAIDRAEASYNPT